MGFVKATGQLKHRFHGEYSAVIALGFDSFAAAQDAHRILGAGWSLGQNTKALVWSGNSEELEVCKKLLAKHGADADKIDSVRYSVDYGEAFECKFEVVPAEQGNLF